MNKKKLLILGSDFGTIEVVKEAKKIGMYVIVTDLMQTSPSKELADESWLVSTTDIDELEKRCVSNNVTAIMFGASDFNINNARELCKRLSLPIYCENDYAWSVARDKKEFKNVCQIVGAPVAEDYYVSDSLTKEELEQIKYPVVVKPSDKSGNRGMSYCNNADELIEGYKNARSITEREIIVERRLYGEEYNVHYVLANGEARLLYFNSTHHQPEEIENIYSLKITTSYHLKQYLTEVNEQAMAVIKHVGCKEGIVWFDCMRDKDGKFYLLEMGYRFGGVMTYVPYEKVSGFNTIKWMLEIANGVNHKIEDISHLSDGFYTGCAASYHLFSKYDGIVKSIEGLSGISKLDNVYIDMPKREGASVRKNACMGLIGIYGKDIEHLCNTLKKINECFHIYNEECDDMIIYYNDYELLKSEYALGMKEF